MRASGAYLEVKTLDLDGVLVRLSGCVVAL